MQKMNRKTPAILKADSSQMRLRLWNLEAERTKKHPTGRDRGMERRAYQTHGGINHHVPPGNKK